MVDDCFASQLPLSFIDILNISMESQLIFLYEFLMALASKSQIMRPIIHDELVKVVWIIRPPIRIVGVHTLAFIEFFFEDLTRTALDGGEVEHALLLLICSKHRRLLFLFVMIYYVGDLVYCYW